MRVIEKIHNNQRSITLMSNSDGIYSVTFRDGIHVEAKSFPTLVDALKHFNELAGMFE